MGPNFYEKALIGNIGKFFGNKLSSVTVEQKKNEIEKILQEEKKRIVIFIDDIDRLDKSEIQAIFKLVKLSAGFSYTTYVLAFDQEMVASALNEKYGNNSYQKI